MRSPQDLCHLSTVIQRRALGRVPVSPGLEAPPALTTIPLVRPQNKPREVKGRTGLVSGLSGYQSVGLPLPPFTALPAPWAPPAPRAVASSLPKGTKQLAWESAWLHPNAGVYIHTSPNYPARCHSTAEEREAWGSGVEIPMGTWGSASSSHRVELQLWQGQLNGYGHGHTGCKGEVSQNKEPGQD